MIKIERVGHLVVSVSNLERSLDFYTRILGLKLMGRIPGVAFLSAGGRDHHELALGEVGSPAGKARPDQLGLVHFAFRLRTEDDLVEAYESLEREGVPFSCTVNHGVTKSIYVFDPDGHEVEFYVDNTPEEIATFENPYFGLEKLPFARDKPSLLEAYEKSQAQVAS